MKQDRLRARLANILATMGLAAFAISANAQAGSPTAVQQLQLSAFAGGSGVFTGLSGGRNLSITGGVDLALPPYRGLRPTIEVRGTYPVDKGQIDSQEDVLGGLRVDFLNRYRLHPYADFLVGRGQMNYGQGYIYNSFDYELTTTWVYSPGAGVDFGLTDRFDLKVDGQFQHWSDTPTPSGSLYSKIATVAVVYRFDFNPHHKR